uniref:Uncharacterized protein n=1 Tax=Megaselia scalaris TaxID=36166 RepID=T1H596_MEGSC
MSSMYNLTLLDAWSCVKSVGRVSEKFQTLRGFRQGYALSSSFFNILINPQIGKRRLVERIENQSHQESLAQSSPFDFDVVKDFIYMGSENVPQNESYAISPADTACAIGL